MGVRSSRFDLYSLMLFYSIRLRFLPPAMGSRNFRFVLFFRYFVQFVAHCLAGLLVSWIFPFFAASPDKEAGGWCPS